MAYTMNIRGRRIYLALMASSEAGDYIVYEWNDGVFIPSDDDNYPDLEYDDEDDEDDEENEDDDLYELQFSGLVDDNDDDEDEEEGLLDDDEDEVESAVREDIEAILSEGFVPQGGVSAVITPEYTTCYTQAFYRKK